MIALWALAALALALKIKGEPEANDRAAGVVEAESWPTGCVWFRVPIHQMRKGYAVMNGNNVQTQAGRRPARSGKNAICRQWPFARLQRFRHSESYLYSGAAFS
jgi:hypothetical protein